MLPDEITFQVILDIFNEIKQLACNKNFVTADLNYKCIHIALQEYENTKDFFKECEQFQIEPEEVIIYLSEYFKNNNNDNIKIVQMNGINSPTFLVENKLKEYSIFIGFSDT